MALRHEETIPTGILNSAEELRQLIIDNPGLPLLIFAGEDANSGDWCYMSCSYVRAYVGEFLDCSQTVNDCKCYCDRDDFEEDIQDVMCDDFEGTDEEFEQAVKDRMAEYDPYWKPCIIVNVNN